MLDWLERTADRLEAYKDRLGAQIDNALAKSRPIDKQRALMSILAESGQLGLTIVSIQIILALSLIYGLVLLFRWWF